MSLFLRLLSEADKAAALREVCGRYRAGGTGQRPVGSEQQTLISGRRTANGDPRVFKVEPKAFAAVPGRPFAYWVSDAMRETFLRLPALGEILLATSGTGTLDDFRFLRSWWETFRPWPVTNSQKWVTTQVSRHRLGYFA